MAVAQHAEKLKHSPYDPEGARLPIPAPTDIPPRDDPRNPHELCKKELAVKRKMQKQLEPLSGAPRHEWLRERFG